MQLTGTSINSALKSITPSIAKFKKEVGEEPTVALVTIFLIDTVTFFNVGKSMDDVQITATAKMILSEYYFLKPEDFKVCFDRAKKGYYGKLYDRLDGSIIMEWLNKYIDERAEVAENESRERHEEAKKGIVMEGILPVLKQVVSELSINEKKVQENEKKEPTGNDVVQEWMKDFDKLYLKQGVDNGIRMINYNGKTIDCNEYLKIRLNEFKSFPPQIETNF